MLFQSAIFPARYIQGPGAISTLPGWISKLGTKAIIVAGCTAIREIIPDLKRRTGQDFIVESFGGECTVNEINRISALANAKNCDVIVALGGGKVIDTVKAVPTS